MYASQWVFLLFMHHLFSSVDYVSCLLHPTYTTNSLLGWFAVVKFHTALGFCYPNASAPWFSMVHRRNVENCWIYGYLVTLEKPLLDPCCLSMVILWLYKAGITKQYSMHGVLELGTAISECICWTILRLSEWEMMRKLEIIVSWLWLLNSQSICCYVDLCFWFINPLFNLRAT